MQPHSRAVPIASAARLAAPRAEPAFPPRSRTGPRTGAASGVLMTEISGFRPLTSTGLPCDLRVPERGAFLLVAVDPVLRGVDVDEGERLPAGQQPRVLRERGGELAGAPCRAAGRCPRYKSAGGSRAWTGRGPRRTRVSIAPSRRRSMSSMLSAPAAMPATRHATFVGRVGAAGAAGPHARPADPAARRARRGP